MAGNEEREGVINELLRRFQEHDEKFPRQEERALRLRFRNGNLHRIIGNVIIRPAGGRGNGRSINA